MEYRSKQLAVKRLMNLQRECMGKFSLCELSSLNEFCNFLHTSLGSTTPVNFFFGDLLL